MSYGCAVANGARAATTKDQQTPTRPALQPIPTRLQGLGLKQVLDEGVDARLERLTECD